MHVEVFVCLIAVCINFVQPSTLQQDQNLLDWSYQDLLCVPHQWQWKKIEASCYKLPMTRMVVGQWSSEETSSWIVTRSAGPSQVDVFSHSSFLKHFVVCIQHSRHIWGVCCSYVGHSDVSRVSTTLARQFYQYSPFLLSTVKLQDENLRVTVRPHTGAVAHGSSWFFLLQNIGWSMMVVAVDWVSLRLTFRRTTFDWATMGGTWWHRVLDQTVQDPTGQHPVVFSSYQDVVGSEYTQEGL